MCHRILHCNVSVVHVRVRVHVHVYTQGHVLRIKINLILFGHYNVVRVHVHVHALYEGCSNIQYTYLPRYQRTHGGARRRDEAQRPIRYENGRRRIATDGCRCPGRGARATLPARARRAVLTFATRPSSPGRPTTDLDRP